MTRNGDRNVQTTLLTISVLPPSLVGSGGRQFPLEKVVEERSPAFPLNLSTDCISCNNNKLSYR